VKELWSDVRHIAGSVRIEPKEGERGGGGRGQFGVAKSRPGASAGIIVSRDSSADSRAAQAATPHPCAVHSECRCSLAADHFHMASPRLFRRHSGASKAHSASLRSVL
jgi:hypothetical protein